MGSGWHVYGSKVAIYFHISIFKGLKSNCLEFTLFSTPVEREPTSYDPISLEALNVHTSLTHNSSSLRFSFLFGPVSPQTSTIRLAAYRTLLVESGLPLSGQPLRIHSFSCVHFLWLVCGLRCKDTCSIFFLVFGHLVAIHFPLKVSRVWPASYFATCLQSKL